MAERNVIRQDVIQIKWDVQDSPLKKLTKESNAFQSSVGKAVGGAESKFGSLAKKVQTTQKQLNKLKLSDRLQSDIERADNALNKVKNTVRAAAAQIAKMRLQATLAVGALQAMAKQNFLALKNSLSAVWTAIKNIVPNAKAFVTSLKDAAKQKITNTVNEMNRIKNVLTEGKTGAKGFATALKNVGKISLGKAVKGITNVKNGFANAKSTVKGFAANIKGGVQNGFQAAANKGRQLVQTIKSIDKASLSKITDSITKLGSKIGKGLVSAAKKAASAIKKIGMAAGAGFAALATASVKGYGDYEQLVGGVETLFKDSSNTVVKYANDAYKTAGLSANDYMETITGFSASLLQGLGGDTKKAAEIGNRAVIDMSDNANKMGTDMASIQNAYQGFAKQNYTMLDNLKLGYGGTKEEMQRLIQDASKMKEAQKELGVSVDASSMSFDNIINAISVVQKKLDIAGTTSKEASTTIQGSINSMKSAWSNFLTGMADPNQNFGQLTDNLVNSIVTVAQNLIPRIKATLPRLAQGVGQLFQQLFTLAVQNFNALGAFAPIGQAIVGTISRIKAQFTALSQDSTKMNTIKTIFSSIRVIVGQVVRTVGDLIVKFTSWATSTGFLNTMKSVLNGIKTALSWVTKNFNTVIQVVSNGAVAFAAFYATVKTITFGIKAFNAVMAVFKARQMMAAGATTAQAAAQWGANAAMLASPVTWVIAGIAALIAIIVLLVKNWDKVKAAAGKCWDFIKGKWSAVSGWFSSKVVQPVKKFFADLWEKVPAPVKDVISKITSGFKKAYDGVTDCWSGISGFFSDLWKGVVKAVAKPVNKLIDGANWVLDKVGSKKQFDPWKPYAKGTGGHPGGNAVVNDGRGAELVQMPNGLTFIPQGRNVGIPNAPKGMKVLDAERTAQVMGKSSPTFHYKEGSGGWISDIFDFFDNAKGLVGKVIDKFISYKGMGSYALSVGKAVVGKAKTAMVDWVKGLFDKFGGKSIEGYEPSKGVEQWRSTVANALKMEGLSSADNIKRTLFQMQTESGGNPRAINRWDSNAKKGTPSKGLMQVIDPTFRSYARKGYNKNIYDPMSNILASVRYAKSRYGSLAKAYRGVGYAGGVGTIQLPAYSPAASVPASSSSTTSNNYAPSFTLNMSGTVDRTTERTIKKWVQEALEDMFDSMSRTSPRLTEV